MKTQFPIFNQTINDEPFVYLDSAATVPMSQTVQAGMIEFMNTSYANVHRGVYAISEQATARYEGVRHTVKQFINASSEQEVIFTSGTTHSLNIVAQSFGEYFLQEGDDIFVSVLEHHANLVPWQQIAKQKKANLVFMPVTDSGQIDVPAVEKMMTPQTKIIAVAHVSNVLGVKNDVDALAHLVHSVGGVIVVDGAQSTPHIPVHVENYDFFAFSGHKLGGLTGTGVLCAKRYWLEYMEPIAFGGDMIATVEHEQSTWAEVPYKFEAGTPNIVGVISMGLAIESIQSIGLNFIVEHDKKLLDYTMQKLSKLPYVTVYGKSEAGSKIGTVAFNVGNLHPHDVASGLDMEGIAVRAGHHCAQPLMSYLGVVGTLRASFYWYNTLDDVERLVVAIEKVWSYFNGD